MTARITQTISYVNLERTGKIKNKNKVKLHNLLDGKAVHENSAAWYLSKCLNCLLQDMLGFRA